MTQTPRWSYTVPWAFPGVSVSSSLSKGRSLTRCQVSLIMAYLMRCHFLSVTEALDLVRSQSASASPNAGFLKQLSDHGAMTQPRMVQCQMCKCLLGPFAMKASHPWSFTCTLLFLDCNAKTLGVLQPMKKGGTDQSLACPSCASVIGRVYTSPLERCMCAKPLYATSGLFLRKVLFVKPAQYAENADHPVTPSTPAA